jgi:hypothetical protein
MKTFVFIFVDEDVCFYYCFHHFLFIHYLIKGLFLWIYLHSLKFYFS